MFDSRFFAFAGFAALLVLSPGATLAVVTDAAITGGRVAGLWTVAGIGSANAALGLAAALGLSAVFARVPGALEAVTFGGAIYLAFLGLRSLIRAGKGAGAGQGRSVTGAPSGAQASVPAPGVVAPAAGSPGARFARGLVTNLLNASVILFYSALLPQFIGPGDPVRSRFLLLVFTHVLMSVVWMGAVAISVGTLSERFAKPAVRRVMEAATGTVLVALALRLVWR